MENAGVRVHCVRPRLQVAIYRYFAANESAARRDGLSADAPCLPWPRTSLHCLRQGSRLLPEHPPARVAIYLLRLCRLVGRSAALEGTGAATSDAFDSPQKSEDYRDVSEKRAPSHSAPRRRRPKTRRRFSADYVFWSSPTQVPTAEALENQGGLRPTMIFNAERRQPR